ncbi:BRO-N domain-containing protein [Marinobacter sp. UBA2498]|jgi:prophage antirepressor-like protein|nr:Bro-N domain-containing protein [Marinobacter sp. UBA2498]|tara:strand:+ start:253 stop:1035 length:783 start_codon:yes stop_codon:yes gene_type:complete
MHNHTQGAPAPSVFHFSSTDLRVLLINEEPWFVAADVCHALAIVNYNDAVRNLDDDEKGVGTIDTLGGKQKVSIINEAGLYCLIFKSRKPEAKKFKRWVTHEVLPAIRKTGSYGVSVWQQPDRASYKLRQQLSDTIQSVTVGFRGKGAAYAINERIRNHFGVRRIEDLTAQQAQDAIFMVKQLHDVTMRWIRAVNKAEKDFIRQVLKDEGGPNLSAPTLVCLDIDAQGIVTPLQHPELKKLQKANRGMHDMLALFQDEEE